MGALSGAVQWWDESQLRVLVLASLGIQYFLMFFAVGRKFSVPSWFRFVIWLLYLGNDALAIYALATLFNRQKKPSSTNVSRNLEVLWAPIMLMHLGGQVFITAYNIEDNELWTRHIVTALSQASFSPSFTS
jgi:protein-S-isoprenylcysteine O-methyltransferase Ste14